MGGGGGEKGGLEDFGGITWFSKRTVRDQSSPTEYKEVSKGN